MVGCLSNCIQAADMGDEAGGVKSLAHQIEGFDHIIGVADTGSGDMRVAVMHIVEVERRTKIWIARAGKKVQAAIKGEDGIGLFDYGFYRGKNKHVIEPFAT